MTDHPPELRHYARLLARQRWLVALVLVVAVGAASALTFTQKPTHRASMSVVVGQGGGTFQPQFGNTVQPFVDTMVRLFSSDVVARTAIANLGIAMTPKHLLSNLQVSTTPDSSVIEATYDSTNRAQAVKILAETGKAFTTLVSQKLGAGATAANKITATVFDPAHLEPGDVSPQPTRTLGIAAVLGLAVGIVLAFVREGLDSRIRSRSDAERWFGAPVLAEFPKAMRGERSKDGDERRSLEAVGMVRASLQYQGEGLEGPLVAVTSAQPQEGKTALVANLGLDLARVGSHVICVEADLRHPELCRYLTGRQSKTGLTDLLAGRAGLEVVLVDGPNPQATDGHGQPQSGRLQILPAGRSDSNPAELLTAGRVEGLLADLRERADYVIFDTPPILHGADAFTFARGSDSVIVVASEQRTTRQAAEAARTTLERLHVSRFGVVLFDATEDGRSGY